MILAFLLFLGLTFLLTTIGFGQSLKLDLLCLFTLDNLLLLLFLLGSFLIITIVEHLHQLLGELLCLGFLGNVSLLDLIEQLFVGVHGITVETFEPHGLLRTFTLLVERTIGTIRVERIRLVGTHCRQYYNQTIGTPATKRK
jgi:hypothetical protein